MILLELHSSSQSTVLISKQELNIKCTTTNFTILSWITATSTSLMLFVSKFAKLTEPAYWELFTFACNQTIPPEKWSPKETILPGIPLVSKYDKVWLISTNGPTKCQFCQSRHAPSISILCIPPKYQIPTLKPTQFQFSIASCSQFMSVSNSLNLSRASMKPDGRI